MVHRQGALKTEAVPASHAMLRAGFRLLNHVGPGIGARLAEAVFFTPPRPRPSPRSAGFLATGRRVTLDSKGRRIAAWTWGEGPVVYLVHGWGGRGGQLVAFVEPLVANGFAVVSFDAPGHGISEGRRTSLLDFADTLRILLDAFGSGHAVIAHSLGAAATALALTRGVAFERAVFIGPPADPVEWTRRFARHFRIGPHVLDTLQARTERRLGFRWSELNVPGMAAGLATPLLVVHDRGDDEVPWTDGAAIAEAWPGARLLTTTGLGHRQVLRDPDVVAEVVGFVAARPAPTTSERPRTRAFGTAERAPCGTTAALDRYLYNRDLR